MAIAEILKGNPKHLGAGVRVKLKLGGRKRRPQPLLVSENWSVFATS